MERLLLAKLLDWKKKPRRKPVLIDGARQVGKSYLVEKLFGQKCFDRVLKFDFLENPDLASLFSDGLDPRQVIENIEIIKNTSVDLDRDLLFFDEIGECQQAVNSLKFFAEKMPQAHLCASGSNIGLLDSFPVGKVHQLELYPMCFEEFLMASGQQPLLKAFKKQSRSQVSHDALWRILLDYYYVGGMPEAVAAWCADSDSIYERSEAVKQIHSDLIAGYVRDFGKYSGKVHAQHIEAVFFNVSKQLSKNLDGSVKRYIFKEAIPQKQRYSELSGPISWLEKTKLISKCFPINHKPMPPLSSYAKENKFKLFLFDVGLLGYMLDMSYADQLAQKIQYKGYIAENFVQNEIRSHMGLPTYSWEEARGEIEFVIRSQNHGDILPVEVKSGSRTRAKSLRSYQLRYQPRTTIKLIGSLGNTQSEEPIVWPLYFAQFLKDL